jgi:5-(carboxyamino)imidazole ribonucleotide mutase
LAVNDPVLAKQLEEFRAKQSDTARSMNLPGY